jgi:homeobox-leucine zipper protein
MILITFFKLWNLLQLCSGIDESSIGACAQLVFAPIDKSFVDDALLVPSGFRVTPLDPESVSIIVLLIVGI